MSIQFASDSTDPFPSALCRQTDPEIFFPEKGGTCAPAKKIRAACVHSQDDNPCLEDALVQGGERFGVRGGKTERERRKILQARAKAAK